MNSGPAGAARVPPALMHAALNVLPEVTETLMAEFAASGTAEPDWPDWKWGVARAVVVIQGMSGVLAENSAWRHAPGWQDFLSDQRDHIAARQRAVAGLLDAIATAARAAGVQVMPLKGAALPAFGLAPPGSRPMADLDLLVSDADRAPMITILRKLSYREGEESWKHLAFEQMEPVPCTAFGEHRDRPVGVDLHFAVRERLAGEVTDITDEIRALPEGADMPRYASRVELLRHLLLHSAADFARQWLRGTQLRDIALLAAQLERQDWQRMVAALVAKERWWMFAPLRLTARYWPEVIPPDVIETLAADCNRLHRRMAGEAKLHRVSASNPHMEALPELFWSRSVGNALRYCGRRIFPPHELVVSYARLTQQREFAARDSWFRISKKMRLLKWIFDRPFRPATVYSISGGLESQLANAAALDSPRT